MLATHIGELEIHPAAQLFPEMDQDALNKLQESVKQHGVQKPIILQDGKLVDGRNRVRAALMCGIPYTQLLKVNLPEDVDPYQLAWMMNCERLDYRPAQKAEIWLRIAKESGEFEVLLQQAKEEGSKKRSDAAKARQDKGKSKVAPSGAALPAATPHPTAVKMAKAANVSPRTMQRIMGRISNGGSKRTRVPKTNSGVKNWSVPRNVRKLAVFLLTRMPSDEVKELARLLLHPEEVEAAA